MRVSVHDVTIVCGHAKQPEVPVSHETHGRHCFLSRCLKASTFCQLQRVAVFGCSQRREWVAVAENEESNLVTE